MPDSVKLIWATPSADNVVGYCARVSNPANQDNPDVAGLLRYCAKHGHWSVFEMASMCVEINTTRDIARQILRHRSFSFQEFSQRYADVTSMPRASLRECRLQDTKNRQNSLPCDDPDRVEWWNAVQSTVYQDSMDLYQAALANGIAKEQARALLPEGLTPSRMYVTGTLRSWVTYCQVRTDPSTQKEHRELADRVVSLLAHVAPTVAQAFFPLDWS